MGLSKSLSSLTSPFAPFTPLLWNLLLGSNNRLASDCAIITSLNLADVMIIIRGRRESLQEIFDDVIEAGIAESPYAIESRMTIWICRGLRRPIEDMWEDYKAFG